MAMFAIPRISEPRQHNVGIALEELFKKKPKFTPAVTESAHAVINATAALTATGEASMFTLDGATDSILSAIYRIEQAIIKGLVTSVVPLDDKQQEQLDAAILIDQTWFKDGIGFIRVAYGIQNSRMVEIRKSLTDEKIGASIKAAVEVLGLGPLVDHFLTHARLYAKKLKLAGEVVEGDGLGDGELRDPSDVWHDLFTQFAIDVEAAYRADPVKRQTLLGPYESQLAEHRADLAKERKREQKKAQEAAAEKKAAAEKQAAAEAEAKKAADATKKPDT